MIGREHLPSMDGERRLSKQQGEILKAGDLAQWGPPVGPDILSPEVGLTSGHNCT